MQREIISFASSSITVEYAGDRAAEIVPTITQQLASGTSDESTETIRFATSPAAAGIDLSTTARAIYQGESLGSGVERFLATISSTFAANAHRGTVFHAAAMAWQECGVLIPGISGAGKSTLAGWLATQGFDYLTDELTYIAHRDNALQGLKRPINLKAPAWPVLAPHIAEAHRLPPYLTFARNRLLPVDWFNGVELKAPPVCLILFPRYQPNTRLTWTPLSRAHVAQRLMTCLINARNLSDHGLRETIRLAQLAPAFKVEYSDFDTIAQEIMHILATR